MKLPSVILCFLLFSTLCPCLSAPAPTPAVLTIAQVSEKRLHSLGFDIIMYVQDNDGIYPPMESAGAVKTALLPYFKGVPQAEIESAFLEPRTGKPYLPNINLSTRMLSPSAPPVVIFYEQTSTPDGTRAVCMTDSYGKDVIRMTEAELQQALALPVQSIVPPAPKPSLPPTVWQEAVDAINAKDYPAATRYAYQMLRTTTDRKAWYYGNVVHEGNQMMGLAALGEGRVYDADYYLLAAGRTPGCAFGPNMVLAQQLLNTGHPEVVIQYLNLIAHSWAHTCPKCLRKLDKEHPGRAAQIIQLDKENQKQIDLWTKEIRAGGKPTLNNSNELL